MDPPPPAVPVHELDEAMGAPFAFQGINTVSLLDLPPLPHWPLPANVYPPFLKK